MFVLKLKIRHERCAGGNRDDPSAHGVSQGIARCYKLCEPNVFVIFDSSRPSAEKTDSPKTAMKRFAETAGPR
jgi:hypothetical protein